MSEAARSGPFWDMIEGRAPMPPVARLLGWTLLSIDPERGEIRVRFEATTDFLKPCRYGAGRDPLRDARRHDGPRCRRSARRQSLTQTLELKTSFYRPARPGPIIGFGRVAHRGRELVFLEGTLSDGEGKSLAAATSTARVIELGAFK
jgi:acyl-coenzyme A thioesterase PaaI-like protein